MARSFGRISIGSALEKRSVERMRPVVVRAAKTLSYGDVIGVLDTCRGAGFEKIGLAADKEDH